MNKVTKISINTWVVGALYTLSDYVHPDGTGKFANIKEAREELGIWAEAITNIKTKRRKDGTFYTTYKFMDRTKAFEKLAELKEMNEKEII